MAKRQRHEAAGKNAISNNDEMDNDDASVDTQRGEGQYSNAEAVDGVVEGEEEETDDAVAMNGDDEGEEEEGKEEDEGEEEEAVDEADAEARLDGYSVMLKRLEKEKKEKEDAKKLAEELMKERQAEKEKEERFKMVVKATELYERWCLGAPNLRSCFLNAHDQL